MWPLRIPLRLEVSIKRFGGWQIPLWHWQFLDFQRVDLVRRCQELDLDDC